MKRKRSNSSDSADLDRCEDCGPSESSEFYFRPAKRITMCYNTPKQQKDEKKRLMKLSKKKLKHTDETDANLLRTVLINNTFLKLKSELGLDQKGRYYGYGINPRSPSRSRFSHSHREEVLRQKYLLDRPFTAAHCDMMDGIAEVTSTTAPLTGSDEKTAESQSTEEHTMDVATDQSAPTGRAAERVNQACDEEMRDEAVSFVDCSSISASQLPCPSSAYRNPLCTDTAPLVNRGERTGSAIACGVPPETSANPASSRCSGVENNKPVSPGNPHFPSASVDYSQRMEQAPGHGEEREAHEAARTVPKSALSHFDSELSEWSSDDGSCDTDSEEIDVVTVSASHESEANRMQATHRLDSADSYNQGNSPESRCPLPNGKSIHNPSLSFAGVSSHLPAEPMDLWSKTSFKSTSHGSFYVQSLTNLPAQPHFSKPAASGEEALQFKSLFSSPLPQTVKSEHSSSDKRDKENSQPRTDNTEMLHSDSVFRSACRNCNSAPSGISCSAPSIVNRGYLFGHGENFPYHPFDHLGYLFQQQHNLRTLGHCSLERTLNPSSSCTVFQLPHLIATSAFGSHSFIGQPDPASRRLPSYGSLFPMHQRSLSAEPAC